MSEAEALEGGPALSAGGVVDVEGMADAVAEAEVTDVMPVRA